MKKRKAYVLPFLLYLTLFLINCSTTNIMNNPQKRKDRMLSLAHRIQQNPKDAGPLIELGIILIKIQRYERGRILLERAYKLNPEDPKTLFYYGLSLEFCKNEQKAFDIYRNYEYVAYRSPYRRLMKERYNILSRRVMRQYAIDLLRQENLLKTQRLSPKAIIVFPFSYQGQNENYAVLSKGLCEMMITDLSQVKGLQLIERIRLNALLDEMNLARSGLVNLKTAARFGRLLSAGQVLYGAYDILGEDRFRVAMELKDLINREAPALRANSTAALKNLLRLEKRIVFGVIEKMGIELTHEEKQRILRIPTKNIQAFLIYCKGLAQEDAGQFEAAAATYQQALQLDPDFDIVSEKIGDVQSIVNSSDKDAVLASFDRTGPVPELRILSSDLMMNRMQNLSENMRSNLVPGQDNRQTTEEAAISGADVGLGELPDPPRPPVRR